MEKRRSHHFSTDRRRRLFSLLSRSHLPPTRPPRSCSGCTLSTALDNPPVLSEAKEFYARLGVRRDRFFSQPPQPPPLPFTLCRVACPHSGQPAAMHGQGGACFPRQSLLHRTPSRTLLHALPSTQPMPHRTHPPTQPAYPRSPISPSRPSPPPPGATRPASPRAPTEMVSSPWASLRLVHTRLWISCPGARRTTHG